MTETLPNRLPVMISARPSALTSAIEADTGFEPIGMTVFSMSSRASPFVPEEEDPATERIEEDEIRGAVAVQVCRVDIGGARHLWYGKLHQTEIDGQDVALVGDPVEVTVESGPASDLLVVIQAVL